jgi:hypothetical protein
MNRHSPIVVSLFTITYLLVASYFAYQLRNYEFIFYIGVVVLLGCITLVIHAKHSLSKGALWCLSAWGLLHMVGGLVPLPAGLSYSGTKAVFYSWWIVPDYLKYDHVLHAFGFGVATWVCWQLLKQSLRVITPRWSMLTLCVLAGMGLGAANEVIEFFVVLLVPETNVGGYENTSWDLVANVVGCTFAAFCIRYVHLER